MTVYVDNMRAKFGRMVMCHMIADTDEELHAMADRIGVSRRWWQAPPKHRSHYDIALSKRAAAVAAGAVEITWRQTSAVTLRRSVTGFLGAPEDAEAWVTEWRALRRDKSRDQLAKESERDEADADLAQDIEAEPKPPRLEGAARRALGNLASLAGSVAVPVHLPAKAAPTSEHERSDEAAHEAGDIQDSRTDPDNCHEVRQSHA